MQETWIQSLGPDPLKGMATHSSILAWKTPWAEEPKVGHDWATNTFIMWGKPPQLNRIQSQLVCVHTQSWPHAICDSMDCSPRGSSLHGSSKSTGVCCKFFLQIQLGSFIIPTTPYFPYRTTFCANISQFSSLSVMSNSWQPRGLWHARPPCPSPTPRVYSNSCPFESVMPSNHLILCRPFSCLQSFPASAAFKWVSSSHQMAKIFQL